MKSRILAIALSLPLLAQLTGCASIISGARKDIRINSNPPGATAVVTDSYGRQVVRLTTPCVATVRRAAGPYVGATYTAEISKPGYKTETVQIKSTLNPWLLGNLALGGAIGMFIVDPITGAAFYPCPSKIDANLQPVGKGKGEPTKTRAQR